MELPLEEPPEVPVPPVPPPVEEPGVEPAPPLSPGAGDVEVDVAVAVVPPGSPMPFWGALGSLCGDPQAKLRNEMDAERPIRRSRIARFLS